MPLIPLAQQTRPGSEAYSGERLFNMFARPSDGVSPLVLLSRGGLTSSVDLGTGKPVRAMQPMGGSLYAVSGGTVWKISGTSATNVGTVIDGETHLAASATELAIVAGGTYYICDGSSTSSYSTGALTDPIGVAFMDGYFIVIGSSAGRDDALTVSTLDDGTTFDALEFAFAESNPDGLTGIIADHNELWAFGDETVQVFYNSGDSGFPFIPNKGALTEEGCVSGASVAKADNAVFWVTPDGKAARSLGSSPTWISTPEIRKELASSTIVNAFTFSERGHEFYAISRENKTTLVFDMVTSLWHERVDGINYEPWAAQTGVLFNGTEYYGTDSGHVATASETVYTDFGDLLLAEARSPMTENRGEEFRVSRLYLDVAGGGVDIGRTPKVMAQTTKDGVIWGREKWRKLGGSSQYAKRATWNNLGAFFQGAIRFRVTDPVPRDLMGIAVDYD
jgi:hypothetical protein